MYKKLKNNKMHQGNLRKSSDLNLLTREEINELEKKINFFRTASGHYIAWHEYGDPAGEPIIYYHHTGSHFLAVLLHKPALELGYRIIAPDRPGISHSEFRKGWTVLDYAMDMADLANHLGIETFGAVGLSGGGPTLMASAFSIPHRLKFVVVLACAMPVYQDPEIRKSLGGVDQLYARFGSKMPLGIFKIPFSLIGLSQTLIRSPKTFAKMFSSSLSPSDKELFEIPELAYLLMRDFQEFFRQGAGKAAYDAQTVYKPWGFDLSAIEIPILVIQGSDDKFIPPLFSEYLARKARNVTIRMIEGQGHFYHLAYGYNTLKAIRETYH
jgi:pimeloyl-ACP methyl ester carboxylesterase